MSLRYSSLKYLNFKLTCTHLCSKSYLHVLLHFLFLYQLCTRSKFHKISGKWLCVKYTTVCCANSYKCRVDDVNLDTNSDVCIVSAVKSM